MWSTSKSNHVHTCDAQARSTNVQWFNSRRLFRPFGGLTSDHLAGPHQALRLGGLLWALPRPAWTEIYGHQGAQSQAGHRRPRRPTAPYNIAQHCPDEFKALISWEENNLKGKRGGALPTRLPTAPINRRRMATLSDKGPGAPPSQARPPPWHARLPGLTSLSLSGGAQAAAKSAHLVVNGEPEESRGVPEGRVGIHRVWGGLLARRDPLQRVVVLPHAQHGGEEGMLPHRQLRQAHGAPEGSVHVAAAQDRAVTLEGRSRV